MTSLNRIRATWTGFSGAPGVSTFFSLANLSTVADIRAFWLSLAAYIPADVTIQVENTGDIITDTTGDLVDTWVTDPVLAVTGTSHDAYGAPSGFIFHWLTGTVLDGHRAKGSTFLVPGAGGAMQDDGTIGTAALAVMRASAAALVTAVAGDLVVWHRPRAAKAADGSRPAVTARAGGHAVVTASSVPDKVVVLRSRRD